MSWYNATTRLPQTYASLCLTARSLCTGAQSSIRHNIGTYHFQVAYGNADSTMVKSNYLIF